MNNQIKQIADRLKGLREVLGITIHQAAESCGISVEKYIDYESGEIDIPVGVLHSFAHNYGIELTTLLTGNEPHMLWYSLTRNGQGIKVDRSKNYNYQSLAHSFINRKAEPFVVTVESKNENSPIVVNTHPGQEFIYILEGSLKLILNNKEMTLNEGDSIYFNSALPHGMHALNNNECKFLAVIF